MIIKRLNGEQICEVSGLRGADLKGANLRGADLQGAGLRWADLRWADLKGADLKGAGLQGADLRRANFQGANLREADLRWADLRRADLRRANFQGAYLQGADLQGADLRWANFQGAFLQGAYFQGADLRWADLQGADLSDTVLDFRNTPNAEVDAFSQQDGWCIGYRTKRSQYVSDTEYNVGEEYTAPVFSTGTTECHPGISVLPDPETARQLDLSDRGVVKVCFRPYHCHKAGSKWRVTELIVLEDIPPRKCT